MKNLRYLGMALIVIGIIGMIFFAFKGSETENPSETNNEVEAEEEMEEEQETGEEPEENNSQEQVQNGGEIEWVTYTDEELGYSFEYPSNYTIRKRRDDFEIIVSPPEEIESVTDFFTVVVIRYPEKVENLEDFPEELWHGGLLPNNNIAWLKEDRRIFVYENYFIDSEEIAFGADKQQAIKVRENSINPEKGEYRSIVYVLNKPLIYRVTHDLLARETHGEIIDRIESSFKIIK